jgi:uncharacterized protein YciI
VSQEKPEREYAARIRGVSAVRSRTGDIVDGIEKNRLYRPTSTNWELPIVHYLLFYDAAADYLERRPMYRAEHLALARAAHARGELVLGGALANPVDGAVLLFRCDSTAPIEAFVAADPYVKNGLVKSWRIREWTTVVGNNPEVALPPGL